MEFTPIGIIHTPHTSKETCPIQPAYAAEAKGQVELFAKYAAGLQDIENFSHIYLLYHLDRAGEIEMVRQTFMDDVPHGIYASCHPCRPNGIGMSIVRLLGRDGNMLQVQGVDILDRTPLLDIKPYMPKFDCITDASEGWTAGKDWRPKPAGRE